MIPVDEFQLENQQILDLCAALSALLDHPELHQNPITCELLDRFTDRVDAHLTHEDRSLYRELTGHADRHLNQVASQFMSNTHELKRLLAKFKKNWCRKPAANRSAEGFLAEAKEMFRLVDQRIDMESSKLLPLLAKV